MGKLCSGAATGFMGNKILLIESATDGADHVRKPLSEAGFEVIVATDVDDGRELFASSHPDLALIEAALPNDHALALCQELKRSDHGESMPIVVLDAADGDLESPFTDLSAFGCDEYLRQPVDEKTLLDVCERLIVEAAAAASSREGGLRVTFDDCDDELEASFAELTESDTDSAPATAPPSLLESLKELEEAEASVPDGRNPRPADQIGMDTIVESLERYRRPEADAEAPSDAEPPGAQAQPESEGQAPAEAEAETETEATADAETRTEATADTEAETETETETEVESASADTDATENEDQVPAGEPTPVEIDAVAEPAAEPAGPPVPIEAPAAISAPFQEQDVIGAHLDDLFGAPAPESPPAIESAVEAEAEAKFEAAVPVEQAPPADSGAPTPELIGIDPDLVAWDSVQQPEETPAPPTTADGRLPGATIVTPQMLPPDPNELAANELSMNERTGSRWWVAVLAVLAIAGAASALVLLPADPPTSAMSSLQESGVDEALPPAPRPYLIGNGTKAPKRAEPLRIAFAEAALPDAASVEDPAPAKQPAPAAVKRPAAPVKQPPAPRQANPVVAEATPPARVVEAKPEPRQEPKPEPTPVVPVAAPRPAPEREATPPAPEPEPEPVATDSASDLEPASTPIVARPAPALEPELQPSIGTSGFDSPIVEEPAAPARNAEQTRPAGFDDAPAPAEPASDRYARLAEELAAAPVDVAPRAEDRTLGALVDPIVQYETPDASLPQPDSGLRAPTLISRPTPRLSDAERRAAFGTRVVVRVNVAADGTVKRVIVEQGERDSPQTRAVIDAVLRSRYRAGIAGGGSVDAWTRERFQF